MTPNRILQTLDAYERWAARYPPVPHNPLMRAEQKAMLEHWPDVAGRRALDLACGSGRYARLLAQGDAKDVFALDFSAAMLRQVSVGSRIRANMMHLPFVNDVFEIVISGLAFGHAIDAGRWMSEIGRVLKVGGVLLYSDFHPEAARAGLTRSFKDERNRSFTLSHRCYGVQAQREAVAAANLTLEIVHEVRVGEEFQEMFAGSDTFYRKWCGLPLVLIVRARK